MRELIQVSGELFDDVQRSQIFSDSKTFVDSIPIRDSNAILNDYLHLKLSENFNLREFVLNNFKISESQAKDLDLSVDRTMEEHISYLWNILARDIDNYDEYSSLLALPYPYIVPGGRFNEIYYWDSYFTAEGLAVCDHLDIVQNMLDNFVSLIDSIGHIPNGNRVYYESRSQPPFFCSMVDILYKKNGLGAIQKYLPTIETEYKFWMSGARVVTLDDGIVLNRYWDNEATPRPESYREDVELAKLHNDKSMCYRNIRAAAESGWDFSSRWFADGRNLSTINITALIPIDLNSILFGIETNLSKWFKELGDITKFEYYTTQAMRRKQAINQYLWNGTEGFYFDYNFELACHTNHWSLASVYPLFFHAASDYQAKLVAAHISDKFLQVGGLLTTLNYTTEQWDAPNGWAPLHWLAVVGLRNYNHSDLAILIRNRFIDNVRNVFARTGKMMEKYNVCDVSSNATGGEYPLQDGFGWTNGVVIALLNNKFIETDIIPRINS